MGVHTRVCVAVGVCTYTCAHGSVAVGLCTFVCARVAMGVCTCACVCVFMGLGTYVCEPMCVHMCACAHVRACVHMCVHVHLCVCRTHHRPPHRTPLQLSSSALLAAATRRLKQGTAHSRARGGGLSRVLSLAAASDRSATEAGRKRATQPHSVQVDLLQSHPTLHLP